MKIYIDAGHGGSDSGAVGNGIKEKDITLKIALKIRDLIRKYNGVETKMSRTTDKTVSLQQRTDEANKWGADFFLSVHINAGGGVGYEDFIYDKLSNTSETAKIRDIIHSEIIKIVDFTNRGKKKANFHVLRETKMNAMLSENGFIDNKSDTDKLKSDSYLDKIAQAHVNGISKAYNLKKVVTPVKPKINKDVIYRVITGSFSDRNNAEKRINELKSKGFDSFIDIYKK